MPGTLPSRGSASPTKHGSVVIVGVAAVLAAGALLWAAGSDRPRAIVIERPTHMPPAPIHAELQAIPARIDLTLPDIASADEVEPISSPRSERVQPRPARTRLQPRDELAAALLARRKQMFRMGTAGADVDAVARISFDPSRRSARVVYRVEDSAAEVVEYWALRDGRWQPLND